MFKSSNASLIAIAALVATTSGAGVTYDYKKNGADWGDTYADCKLTNQSPIDLKTAAGAYTEYASSADKTTKDYTDQTTDIKVGWTGDTTKIAVNKAGQAVQTFTSELASTVYGANKEFTGVQFHFHAGSEHTIDGKRHDLEMHTVHLATTTLNKFGYAAVGIMFSVADYDKSVSADMVTKIDAFFDSLQLDKTNDPLVAKVPYATIMEAMDWGERWMYSGSVTTPVCAKSVMWNVFTKIYPIKQKHLDLFVKTQLARGANDLKTTGNWRVTSPVDNHNVIKVTATPTVPTATGANFYKLAAATSALVGALYLY